MAGTSLRVIPGHPLKVELRAELMLQIVASPADYPMQHIFIENLEIDCVVGVFAHERVQRQTLRFDIEVGMQNLGGFQSDRLDETVDYAQVAQLVRDELSATSFKLLERLADHLADCIAERFDVNRVRLRIAKGAIVPGASRVGVVLDRKSVV